MFGSIQRAAVRLVTAETADLAFSATTMVCVSTELNLPLRDKTVHQRRPLAPPWRHSFMTTLFAATLLGVVLLAAPAAFADDAHDNILRAETKIAALNPGDATAASGADYQAAKLRLEEARAAEGRNRKDESLWRSSEAMLHADIVQENIKLRGLQRTVSEIETGVETLRRELNS